MAAAERGIWTAAQLRRLLITEADYELSAPSVAALMTGDPVQVKLTTLAALCTALGCTPNDLITLDPVARPGDNREIGRPYQRQAERSRAGVPSKAGVFGRPLSTAVLDHRAAEV